MADVRTYTGANCPNCGDYHGIVSEGSMDSMGGGEFFQDFHCETCGAEFVEFYGVIRADVRTEDMDESEPININSPVLQECE